MTGQLKYALGAAHAGLESLIKETLDLMERRGGHRAGINIRYFVPNYRM